jgi:2-octaprenylphenol hydroxylase
LIPRWICHFNGGRILDRELEKVDIIVVGCGIAGATAAIALAQNTSLQILILDSKPLIPTWQENKFDSRVNAISPAAQRIFQQLDVWSAITAKRISPFKKMQIYDGAGNGKLHFNCRDIHTPEMGFIVEENAIKESLWEKLRTLPNIRLLAPVELAALTEHKDYIELVTSDKQCFHARLLIAADGGLSWIREQANIELNTHQYHHEAIVCTVRTQKPHQQTAWQRFLTTGILAFLPLPDAHASSIVWSTTQAHANTLRTLDDEAFKQALTQAFAHLGEVTEVSPRVSFNLQMRHTRQYVKARMALIGDAAHTIHPLAGQGVNLGLLDAASLTEVVLQAIAKKRDFASLSTLRRYERWRKAENAAMLGFVGAIKDLFGNETAAVKSIRNLGLNMINNVQSIKNFFANYAAGNRSHMPILASKKPGC